MADSEYLTVPHLGRKKIARLFSKISVDKVSGCWNWTAAISRKGYGVTSIRSEGIHAHRLMYAWLVGPLRRGKGHGVPELDHATCQNRRCCNPAHLELVSAKTNVLRGTGRSAQNAKKTTCPLGHPLEPRKNGKGRFCRRCSSDASLASYYAGRRKDSRPWLHRDTSVPVERDRSERPSRPAKSAPERTARSTTGKRECAP